MAHGLDFALQDQIQAPQKPFHTSATNWVINVRFTLSDEVQLAVYSINLSYPY